MENITPQNRTGKSRGRFKLVIYFIDHRLDRGFTIFSNRNQDARGVSVQRFKELVLHGKFAGQVRWAGIYEWGKEVWQMGC